MATLEKTENKGLSDVNANIAKMLDTALIDARKQIIDADANLYNADEILGLTDANRTKNDSYEVYLSAKNITLRSKAESDWGQATALLAKAKSSLDALSPGSNNSTDTKSLLDVLSQTENALILL